MGYDDSLDAFGVHGICGIWGALATGIFANPAVNAAGTGLLLRQPRTSCGFRLVSILATAAYTAVATLVVVWVTKLLTGGLRVDAGDEIDGLDNSLHGERAFEIQM